MVQLSQGSCQVSSYACHLALFWLLRPLFTHLLGWSILRLVRRFEVGNEEDSSNDFCFGFQDGNKRSTGELHRRLSSGNKLHLRT